MSHDERPAYGIRKVLTGATWGDNTDCGIDLRLTWQEGSEQHVLLVLQAVCRRIEQQLGLHEYAIRAGQAAANAIEDKQQPG